MFSYSTPDLTDETDSTYARFLIKLILPMLDLTKHDCCCVNKLKLCSPHMTILLARLESQALYLQFSLTE